MNTTNNGGPAFPMQEPQAIHSYAINAVEGMTDPDERDRAYTKARAEAVGGMSLRDYFAAKALQGLIVGVDRPEVKYLASAAYTMADAMLAERKRNK